MFVLFTVVCSFTFSELQKIMHLTQISPPLFLQVVTSLILMSIICIWLSYLYFCLFLNKAWPFLFAIISDLPWFIFVLALRYVIDYTYVEKSHSAIWHEIWGVGLIRVNDSHLFYNMQLYCLKNDTSLITNSFTKTLNRLVIRIYGGATLFFGPCLFLLHLCHFILLVYTLYLAFFYFCFVLFFAIFKMFWWK